MTTLFVVNCRRWRTSLPESSWTFLSSNGLPDEVDMAPSFMASTNLSISSILGQHYNRRFFAQGPNIPNQVEAADLGHIHGDERNVVVPLMNILARASSLLPVRIHRILCRLKNHFQVVADIATAR